MEPATAGVLTHYLFALQVWEFVQQMFECPLLLGQKWWAGVIRERDQERTPRWRSDSSGVGGGG